MVLQNWIHILGIGPWTLLTLHNGNVSHPIVGGKPAEHPFRYQCATAMYGDIQIEIVQPAFGVPPLDKFIEKSGEGLQHFKEKVLDADQPAFIARMAQKGVGVAYAGGVLRDTFVNFDTKESLGFTLEIGNYADNPLPEGTFELVPMES